jgi:hypothetical protein
VENLRVEKELEFQAESAPAEALAEAA